MAERRSIILVNWKFQLKVCLYVSSWIAALSVVYPLILDNLFAFTLQLASVDMLGPTATKMKTLIFFSFVCLYDDNMGYDFIAIACGLGV